jgi:hypothetical protein
MSTRITALSCSECPTGEYRTSDVQGTFVCKACGYAVHRSDVDRYLDLNERLTTRHNNTSTPDVVIIRTEACECCGSISNGHFSVRVGDSLPATLIPCPNDV